MNTPITLEDGAYQVHTDQVCAGFVVKAGVVVECAPVLWRKIEYWKLRARLVSA